MFAQIGFKTLRYPVLWERTAPDGLRTARWEWADERLGRLRDLGIRPIVGLVHHGSGPRHTSLVSPTFGPGLAEFAGAVAERYPWVEDYTPVNEPLTTARFSGLYGYWYPHSRDGWSWAKALLEQCRGVSLAMRAIRQVNPAARLVQTEDMGKTFATPLLSYQADFENERRWLSFDLLCGRVNPAHRMWGYLLYLGIGQGELEWFLENPCPPDIFGLNYYLTSERYLDERLEVYPSQTRGGNSRHTYADVEAVRVRASGLDGPKVLLREAWERYAQPIAVTEAHNGCTREEQIRWFNQVWEAALTLRAEGADIRAVTAWSLLGAYDWDSLVQRAEGHYEPGVFDLRATEPRPTAMSKWLEQLAHGQRPSHPALNGAGWWERPRRLIYGFAVGDDDQRQTDLPQSLPMRRYRPNLTQTNQPLLITGAGGTLGQAFARICEWRGLPYALLSRAELDITNPLQIETALAEWQPWAVINTAGYVRVDQAEDEAERCFAENAIGPALLATACARHSTKLLTFSSDLVFDGQNREPYLEEEAVNPLNVYGRSKAQAEREVLAALPGSLIVRTSAFFGPWDEYNFVTQALQTLAAGHDFHAASDALVSPTYVPDLVQTSLDLLLDDESGLWHLANPGGLSWADLARQAAHLAGISSDSLVPVPTRELSLRAVRPAYSVLGSARADLMPPLENALSRYLSNVTIKWREPALAWA